MRVAISATWCETAWRSLSGPPNAVRWAVWSRVASRAARAIPTANAPTLGRKRLRVFIATRKPRSGSPRTSSAVTGTPSNSRVPMGCGESMSRAEPVSPGRSDGTRNAVMPRAPAPGVVRAKTTAKSASGALEIQHFSPVSAQPAGVCSAARLRAAASEPAPGSLRAKAATARPARTSGSQRSRWAGCRLDDRSGAEALEGEGGLGLGAAPGQGLAQQAQVQRPGTQHPAEETQLAQSGQQRAVDAPGFPLLRQWAQLLCGEGAELLAPGGLFRFEGECRHGGASLVASFRVPRRVA